MKTISLRLYHLSWCSYCWYVRTTAEKLGIQLELVDLDENPKARQYLIDARGRATTPVLGRVTEAGEELMGESRQIVKYLENLPSAENF